MENKSKPCPFCGGKAIIVRELNCDTLIVEHAEDCFIRSAPIKRFHWNDLGARPEVAFADWERRYGK